VVGGGFIQWLCSGLSFAGNEPRVLGASSFIEADCDSINALKPPGAGTMIRRIDESDTFGFGDAEDGGSVFMGVISSGLSFGVKPETFELPPWK
jgi:hypothetical protein